MNIIIDLLPKIVEIDGIEYEINSNFRVSMLFELLMQDQGLSDKDKIFQALELYYPILPKNIDKAVEKMLWFYRCGKDIVKSKDSGKGKSVTNIYDFEFDDDYIYAAFLYQYGIDIQDIEYLHWWKFKAMFKALNEENEIVKIMGYRAIDLSKLKDKEQKAFYKKMKDLYKIPMNKTETDKLKDIERALINNDDFSILL